MKELIGIQLTLALAMIVFSQMLSFTPETVMLIMGGAQFLNAYIIGYFWNRAAKKQDFYFVRVNKENTGEEYDISIKDGTVG